MFYLWFVSTRPFGVYDVVQIHVVTRSSSPDWFELLCWNGIMAYFDILLSFPRRPVLCSPFCKVWWRSSIRRATKVERVMEVVLKRIDAEGIRNAAEQEVLVIAHLGRRWCRGCRACRCVIWYEAKVLVIISRVWCVASIAVKKPDQRWENEAIMLMLCVAKCIPVHTYGCDNDTDIPYRWSIYF